MVRIYRVALTLTGRCNGPGIRTSLGRLDISGLHSRSRCDRLTMSPHTWLDGDRLLATSTDPWSIVAIASVMVPDVYTINGPGISCDYRHSGKQKL